MHCVSCGSDNPAGTKFCAVHALNRQRSHPLQVRIGLHTGPVVVGAIGGGGRQEQLALGEVPNLAARLQGQAAPNTVVISAVTYRLVQGLFECQALGLPALKGVTTPLALYRVVREGEAQSRFEGAVSAGLTPLVGREEELGLLRRRWEQAKASNTKHTRCWPRSTAGSPKGLIPKTCKRPKHCWTS